jgi:peptidoglycan-associated lipoprotein
MNSPRLLALILAALVAACATTENQTSTTTPGDQSSATSDQGTAATRPTGRQSPGGRDVKGSTQTRAANLDKNSVYFDYDKFDIKPEYHAVIEEHAKYLRANSSMRARIEGNADERGSREYNVALGQKRAEAVMKTMGLLGVPANRMEAVSYGEEKPRRTGHDEASHAENRRGDLVFEAAK